MNLHTLRPAKGATHHQKRIARGEGSGHGGTSTAGNKGAQSRSGYKSKRGHEGGQTPIQRRLPKRGFKNLNRIEFVVFNLSDLAHYATKFNVTAIDFDVLRANHLISKTDKIKVLANGELGVKLNVKAHSFSAKAKEAIEAKGGVAEILM
jgi:large subunit ribosomal protein L15